MDKAVITFTLLFCFNIFAQERLVFLVEDDIGKYVGSSIDLKTVDYLVKDLDWNLYPTISSDGKKMAYIKGADSEHLRLILRELSTGKERAFGPAGFVLHPKFSQNGKSLFFSMKDNGINKIGFIKNLEKAEIKFLTKTNDSFFPSPFQSAELIVYQRNSEKKEIVLKNLLNGEIEVIAEGMSPALSKDERFIAYTSKKDENWDINIYDRFSKKTIKVTSHESRDFSPSFDRHNNLIFTSDRLENGVFSIYKKNYLSWLKKKEESTLLISKKGTSFYAPHISGLPKYKTDLEAKMPGEARSSFGAINHKGEVYIVGGHQGAEHTYPPESFTGRVSSYHLKTKNWSKRAPRLFPSHGFQLVSYKNSIFAFGGFAYEKSTSPKWKSLSVVEKYNPKDDKWTRVADMPRKRSSNIVARIGDKVYLVGGWDATPKFKDDIDGTFHDEIDVFDLKTESWSTLKVKLPLKRRAFSAFVKNDRIYMLGGISESGSHFNLLNNFTEFDPEKEQFKELAPLPFGTFAPASGSLKDEAYLFGGMFKTGEWNYEYVPHIYRYSFKLKKWEHTGRYLNEYKGFSQTVKIGACLGVLGGHSYKDGKDSPIDSFEKFCR